MGQIFPTLPNALFLSFFPGLLEEKYLLVVLSLTIHSHSLQLCWMPWLFSWPVGRKVLACCAKPNMTNNSQPFIATVLDALADCNKSRNCMEPVLNNNDSH